MMQLLSFEINGFRGIRQLAIEMQPGKALLLHGLNGTGKSSLHQALTFGFTGQLPPVAEAVDAPSAAVFRHAALDSKTPAWVRVEFSDDTNTHSIVREIMPNGLLSVKASTPGAVDLAEAALNQFCFITRRSFSSMVDAVERDSWTRLTPFLGHQQLATFREGLRGLSLSIRRDLKISETEATLTKQTQVLLKARNQIRVTLGELGLEDWSAVIMNNELAKLVPGLPLYDDFASIPWDDVEAGLPASTKAKELNHALKRLAEEHSLISMVGATGNQLTEAVDFSVRVHTEPTLAHDLVHAEFLVASSNAVRNLSDEHCPLCGLGPVDWNNVRVSLGERSKAVQGDLRSLQASRTSISTYHAAVVDLAARLQEWAGNHEERAELAIFRQHVQALESMAALVQMRLLNAVPEGLDAQEKETLDGLRKETTIARKEFSDTVKCAITALEAQQASMPGASELKRLFSLREAARLQIDMLRTEKDVARLEIQHREAQSFGNAIQALSTAVTDAESELSTSLLAQLETEVRRIFGILTDNHQLQPKISTRTDRGIRYADIVIGDFYGLGPVPARDYLSEANRNSLGLAIYFAGLLNRKPLLQLLVIDDITHSADNGHRRGLAQFIANELADRLQLIVLTHDDNWHDRLKSTLPAGRTLELQVIKWSPDGLILKSDNWSSLLEKAEDQINRREASGGNALRQALEQFVDEACERYAVEVPFKRSAASLKFDLKRQRLEIALREAWKSGAGLLDPGSQAVRLLVHSQRITNLASHYASFESWDQQDLIDVFKDVKDVVAFFSCKHTTPDGPCGALLPELKKRGGTPPTCRQCKQPILL